MDSLVDGNIDRIKAEAKARKVKVTTIINVAHVLPGIPLKRGVELLRRGRPRRRDLGALAVLEGNARNTAAAIRRKATRLNLPEHKRAKADRAAYFLLNKPRASTTTWRRAGRWRRA